MSKGNEQETSHAKEARPPVGKWLGIDYGEARIGIAVSDPLGILARGLATIRWHGGDMDGVVDQIVTLAAEAGIVGLVIGIPRRTDGKPGESEARARDLAARLGQRTGLPTVCLDERYTTVLATRQMRENGLQPGRRRDIIDQVAAEIILQEYLDSRRQAE